MLPFKVEDQFIVGDEVTVYHTFRLQEKQPTKHFRYCPEERHQASVASIRSCAIDAQNITLVRSRSFTTHYDRRGYLLIFKIKIL